jgi:hypothetical protein
MESLKKHINDSKYNNDFSFRLIEAEEIFFGLHESHGKKWHRNWGGYLFNGRKYEYCIDMYDKQKLLYETSKNKNRILEVGTYVGHSLLIMLLANPKLEITCIDLSDEYAKPSIEFLQSKFPNSKIDFIHGSSLEVLPTLKTKYDLFHIDGTHENDIITKEFHYCLDLRSSDTFSIIFDDVETCQPLVKETLSKMNIIDQSTPGCPWTNAYYKIKV